MKIFYIRLIPVLEGCEDWLMPRFNDNLYLKPRVFLTDWKEALQLERGPAVLVYLRNKIAGRGERMHIGLMISGSDLLSGAMFA